MLTYERAFQADHEADTQITPADDTTYALDFIQDALRGETDHGVIVSLGDSSH